MMTKPKKADERPACPPQLEKKLAEAERLENDVNTLAEKLSTLKAQRKDLNENEIPTMVRDLGLRHTGCVLADGTPIKFELKVQCGVSADHREDAHRWLNENGAGHLLRRHLTLSFGPKSADLAQRVRNMVAKILPQYEVRVSVGSDPDKYLAEAVMSLLSAAEILPLVEIEDETTLPGPTLSSYVKKCLGDGTNLPAFFNVYAPLVAVRLAPTPAEDAKQAEILKDQLERSVK